MSAPAWYTLLSVSNLGAAVANILWGGRPLNYLAAGVCGALSIYFALKGVRE